MSIRFAPFLRRALPLIALCLVACGKSAPTTYSVGGTVSGLLPDNSIVLTVNGNDALALSANGAFTFPAKLPDAGAYSVAVAGITPVTQPCTVTNGTGNIHAANVTTLQVTCTANEVAAGKK
jgi:hypothetical protein